MARVPVVFPIDTKKELRLRNSLIISDSRGIQTRNLLIRSQMLYSVELGSHRFLNCDCKGKRFFCFRQIFWRKFLQKVGIGCFIKDFGPICS